MDLVDYRATNDARFPDNDRFQIEACDLRSFAADTADLFGPEIEPLKATELPADKQDYATLSPRAALLKLLGGALVVPANHIPMANAGQDATIQLPTSSVALLGTGSDPDAGDRVVGYAWRQITGPNAATGLPASTQNVVVTGLQAGTYQFGLRTTDTHGATSPEDFVVVTVQPAGSPATAGTYAATYESTY